MNNKMKVAAITDKEKVEILDVRKPTPGKGEVLVKIKANAICTWEQRTFNGVVGRPLPFVGGHEMSGYIEAIGENVDEGDYPIGQKVSIRAVYACGACDYCRKGKEDLCLNMTKEIEEPHKEIWGPGGLGEYLVAPTKDIYKLPADLPYEYGAFTEPLACVVNSVEKGKVELADDVLIIGAGIMGLLHTMVCKLRGARVIVSELDEERRRLAREVGADFTLDPSEEGFDEKVKELTGGAGADAVFNTTAIAEVAKQAINLAAPAGRVIMYSSIHPDKPISVSPNWIHNTQVQITGTVNPSIKSFQTSAKLLSRGIIVPDKLITNKYPLERTQEAFEESIKPETYRILVVQ